MTTKFAYKSYYQPLSTSLTLVCVSWDTASLPRKCCYTTFVILFDVGAALTLFWKCVVEYGDIRKFAECVSFFSYIPLCLFASYHIFKYRREIQELLTMVEDSLFKVCNKDEEEMAIRALWPLKIIKSVSLIYVFLTAGLSAYFAPEKYDYLCIPAWYPFDFSESPVSQLILAHQLMSLLHMCLGFLLAEIILCGCFSFIGLQCDLISHDLEYHPKTLVLKDVIKRHLLLLK